MQAIPKQTSAVAEKDPKESASVVATIVLFNNLILYKPRYSYFFRSATTYIMTFNELHDTVNFSITLVNIK
jgi:hypothetical protein